MSINVVIDNLTLSKDSLLCGKCESPSVKAQVLNHSTGQQIVDFFKGIFDTSYWPERWYCGTWSDFHGWLYILSDLTIWAAYFAIPILLFAIVRKRKDIPFPLIFWLFIAFILFCGTTHLLDAIIFWWPAYRLSAFLRFITAVVSIITVFKLYKTLPLINSLRTQNELETEIREREKAEQETRHLQISQKATEELMNKKDEFMSIASHELKTPITSLKASLQLLQRMMVKKEDCEDENSLINKAVKQTHKLTDIINDLLDVTKIQAGKMELRIEEFNLFDLINECVEESKLESNNQEVIINGDKNLIVSADRIRIDQVICNLLTNAFKYSPKGNTVTVNFERIENGKTKIEVIDEGIGIPEDRLDDVFDRFFRVENTSQNFSGIGLGLYITAEIVKRHGGEIHVKSKLGEGSTFWFTI